MLTAKRHGMSAYEMAFDGVVATYWETSFWRGGGTFTLDGRDYRVRTKALSRRVEMTDITGQIVAVAEKAGGKRWTIAAYGRTYEFRRVSIWRVDQELVGPDGPVGRISRSGMWRPVISADLPGLPPPAQIFAVGTLITVWAQQSAAASAS